MNKYCILNYCIYFQTQYDTENILVRYKEYSLDNLDIGQIITTYSD